MTRSAESHRIWRVDEGIDPYDFNACVAAIHLSSTKTDVILLRVADPFHYMCFQLFKCRLKPSIFRLNLQHKANASQKMVIIGFGIRHIACHKCLSVRVPSTFCRAEFQRIIHPCRSFRL